jgi:hypothetical protein
VASKDVLRNALAQRDSLTEVLRSSPYMTEAVASAEMKQMQDKVLSPACIDSHRPLSVSYSLYLPFPA